MTIIEVSIVLLIRDLKCCLLRRE